MHFIFSWDKNSINVWVIHTLIILSLKSPPLRNEEIPSYRPPTIPTDISYDKPFVMSQSQVAETGRISLITLSWKTSLFLIPSIHVEGPVPSEKIISFNRKLKPRVSGCKQRAKHAVFSTSTQSSAHNACKNCFDKVPLRL